MSKPLEGIRVVDLTSVVLGPYATQILGDLGADVIKVEAPAGDTTRYTGPARSSDMAALFLGLNRNKRSVVLDLKQAEACDALWALIDSADVFVHSIRPQALERLGFSQQAVRKRNPKIVYAALVGYREEGPYSGQPAYDDVIVGRSGLADVMHRATGEPRYMPTIIGDKTCGLTAAYSINAALFARERSGEGQYVEVPMLETMTSFTLLEHLYGHTFNPPIGEIGYARVLAASRRPYATADGHICVLIYTDPQWQRFLKETGRDDLLDDARFQTLASRAEHIAFVYETAGDIVAAQSTSHWLEVFDRLEIPAAPISTLESLRDDPHLQAVGMFRDIAHPTEGNLVMPDAPVRFNHESMSLEKMQPRLGEHSEAVLLELGFSSDEIKAMHTSGATLTHQG